MSQAVLEHANITVQNARLSAELFCRLFDWKIRWSGSAIHEGKSVHVGSDASYLALYEHPEKNRATTDSYYNINSLNHIGIVVQNLDEVEKRVLAEELEPRSHADYEPGRRFYFDTPDGLEVEVISYA